MNSIEQIDTGPSAPSIPSSWSSSVGVAEALASCKSAICSSLQCLTTHVSHSDRRAQYISVEQNVSSSLDASRLRGDEGTDEEARYAPSLETEEDLSEDDGELTPVAREDGTMLHGFTWDEDVESPQTRSSPRPTRPFAHPELDGDYRRTRQHRPETQRLDASEHTPLLKRASSYTSASLKSPKPRRSESDFRYVDLNADESGPSAYAQPVESGKPRLRHKTSSRSAKSEKQPIGGRSTFGQTVSYSISHRNCKLTIGKLFNSIAILLGFGLLAEPLAFSYAGWIIGTLLVISYGMVTCYT